MALTIGLCVHVAPPGLRKLTRSDDCSDGMFLYFDIADLVSVVSVLWECDFCVG
eukprot:CAMPEP_0117040344 /NCGR_PEP_ID=MMETSP0472-20121206/28238_1 /TAXON_ID=693140 ORGANISM="Tiarina fusus, Strain LIS" /NCGR_SAMPLE_ID=MMETSP0472 /ASSEMBLY_ACC=CAM_ASM_000603 /LENGTH=53 /DNA_ID=CAMNT_0004751047 /DNA_START=405 /DNA_END=562 /DNA_ORIENTATION=-